MAPTTTQARPRRRARTGRSAAARTVIRPPAGSALTGATASSPASVALGCSAEVTLSGSAEVALGGPAVVVRPTPALDPPCEVTQARRPVQPVGGMDFLPGDWLAFPGPARPASARPRRAAQPAGEQPLPPPHPAAQRFVGMCVEILNGYRPAAHLRQVTHPKHCTAVTDQLTRRTVRVRMSPSHAARQGNLVRVRRMLVSEPLPGVAELVAVLEQGTTVWAMAVRLERQTRPSPGLTSWLCTLVQVV
ncbi:Rv3235 family protein [Dactylosporangium sp. NPDC050688]|uniref:Rv3235 family protein n=1 Tax=Dactylosporangium sp. NPDC050688 TaxID=3157217 RepID=UPI0033F80CB2